MQTDCGISDESEEVQKLMECLLRFKKLHMNQHQMHGLKSNDHYLLLCIKRFLVQDPDGIKVSELSNILNVTSPTITQQINVLEQNGYVERSMDKEDRRAIRIKLTEVGEAKIKEYKELYLKYTAELAEYLGRENSKKLAELLSMVIDFMSNKSNQSTN